MNRADGGANIVMRHYNIRDASMVTYAEVKASPREKTPMPTKDFELALREFIDGHRKTTGRDAAVAAMQLQTDLLARDETWPIQPTEVEAIGDKPIQQPTESEMKHAAAAEAAAQMAKTRGIEDSYNTDAEAEAELKRREDVDADTANAPDRDKLKSREQTGDTKKK